MIEFLRNWLETFRKPVMSTFCTLPSPEMSTTSLQDQILEACAGKDASRLRSLLERWHERLLKQAAGSGCVEIVQQLFDQYGTTEALNQIVLKEAAQQGNVEVFRFLLQQWPDTEISDDVRSYALEGGVEIWKAILDHSPELINYDFGEKGDLISMAVLMNNVPLLTFFLVNGLDPNKSHYFTKPIIEVATTYSAIKREILDLLVQHGATREKSLVANKVWRDT